MASVNYQGQDVPIVGTIGDNDCNTYVIETGGNLFAFVLSGKTWHGLETTSAIVTKFKSRAEATKLLEAVATTPWHINDEDSISCTLDDLRAAEAWLELSQDF